MVFGRTPEKYEQKALQYEQRGKMNKAIKYREKAAKLRASHPTSYTTGGMGGAPMVSSFPTQTTTQTQTWTTQRTPVMYEQRATKWEQRGNYNKANKNREKVWRLQNPQWNNAQAPTFYNNNQFAGYNVQPIGFNQQQHTGFSHVNAATVETHVHPTIVQTTSRPERITEIQPIIHREIDAPQVRVIEQHVYETVPNSGPSVITKGTIVEETVRPRIIEEVQPVVHREVPATFVERVEQHVTEHITRPTVNTKEVMQDRNVHIAGGMPMGAQGVNQQQYQQQQQQQQGGMMGKVQNALHHNQQQQQQQQR